MSGLLAEAVSVRLGGRLVLDQASVLVRPGEVVVLIGPNGAGKSTLLSALAGDVTPTSGRVLLDGAEVGSFRPRALARRRAVLAQTNDLAFPFTVGETARLGLPVGIARREADAIVARNLALVGLGDAAGRPCSELSGGERQRAHLARVMAQLDAEPDGAPRYLMLDEPTANLDLEHQLATLAVARRHAEAGGGVLAVLHDVNLAAMAADVIVALKAGAIVAAGAPHDVVTDKLVRTLYRVDAEVRGVPEGPFLLPQSARSET
ncbi:heme ABC transporter ATP-binding protein [Hansschlegelia quercus]|uniref:Heme ABC transporter ATP-binding protein n=1 Tax=Hansschlegelia quercus TaxID=2528245 RepID=A0A4Q9GJI5_9HYPH|nr:heme ABC transporter ATP-binding protein [Hansschlegelia quercus]TBN54479.1 heme ABC transporter ATP-binding protein [Hansschlegelia quercus]